MRFSRIKKFRTKNKRIIIASQILIIWYCVLVVLTVLTSNTLAYFSNGSEVKTYITTASDWWDKSELKFTENGTEVIHVCPPTEISVEITNNGLSMTKPTEYVIYYSEKNGEPSKHGNIIYDGLINPIEAGRSVTLTYDTELEGWFVFKALQRPGFKNNYESRSEIWSKKLKVQCIGNKENVIEEDKIEEIDETEEESVKNVEENATVKEENGENEVEVEEEEGKKDEGEGEDKSIEEEINNSNVDDKKIKEIIDDTTNNDKTNNKES